MPLTFRQIEYIVTIHEAGSLSEAAKRLFISQPALSQSLKKLETDLGVSLFNRDSHPFKLTPAGEQFLQEGRALLLQRQQMEDNLRAHAKNCEETLRLGISPFYSKFYLPILYPYILQRFPSLHLEVTEAISVELEALVLDNRLDLCFVPVEPRNPRLTYEPVCMEEILLAAPPHSHLERWATPSPGLPYLDLQHTANENYIVLKPQQKFSAMNRELFSLIGAQPRIVYQTLNWDTVHILISSGMGVGFIPEVLYGSAPAKARPCYFRIANQKTVRVYAVAYRKNSTLSPMARSVMNVFRTSVHAFQSSYRTWMDVQE